MDKNWERIQKKTFTGWVNANLRKVGVTISDMTQDFHDGVRLIQLLEVISGEHIKIPEKAPKLRIKKVINVGVALKFIEAAGVKLVGIGAEEIVDGNEKLILGMIWTIILRFQIQDISEEEKSAKEALLLWCQKKTKGYKDVNVENFHLSFQDGLAFCALIHKHRPDLLDFDSLNKEDKAKNLQLAFDVAEKHLDVPAILDVDDIVNIAKPDERSIMTYVAALYHVFASGMKTDQAAKQVGDFLDFEQATELLKDEYTRRATALRDWTQGAVATLADRNFANSVQGVQAQIQELGSWRSGQKVPQSQEKSALESLFSNIQTKLRINGRNPFVPPQGLSPDDLQTGWDSLEAAEKQRSDALRAELRRQKILANLVARFQVKGKALQQWIDSKSAFLSSEDLGDNVAAVQANLSNLEAFYGDYQAQSPKITTLDELKGKIVEGRHADADAIVAAFEGYQAAWNGLQGAYEARKQRLEAHLAHLQQIQTWLLEYAKSALAFVRWTEDATDSLSEPILAEHVEDVDKLKADLANFAGQVGAKEGEFSALEAAAAQLQQANVKETTYSEYTIGDVNSRWAAVRDLLQSRGADLDAEHEKQQHHENLRVQWAQEAAAFHQWTAEKTEAAKASGSGDLEAQVAALNALRGEIEGGASVLANLAQLSHQIDAAEITDNKHSNLVYDSLKAGYDGLVALVTNSIKVIENEILVAKHAGVTPEDLDEFKETFEHFDKDKNGQLNKLELKSCLQSLGEELKDNELDHVLETFGGVTIENDAEVKFLGFQAFVAYMMSKRTNKNTAEAIVEAFRVMAADKAFITARDLHSCLPKDKADYLLTVLPKFEGVEDGYDYKAYAGSVYASK